MPLPDSARELLRRVTGGGVPGGDDGGRAVVGGGGMGRIRLTGYFPLKMMTGQATHGAVQRRP
jgi:hypothetical protein